MTTNASDVFITSKSNTKRGGKYIEYIYLIRHFSVQYRYIFLRVMQYFGEPEGWVKIQMMSKNVQRYYTLIRDLLSNIFVSPKFWLAKVFNLSRSQGNETSTNIVWYEAVWDNKIHIFWLSVHKSKDRLFAVCCKCHS